jgi:hypothetical protein
VRYKKIFSAVALATILSLLAITLAASPVLAAEEIDLDPDEGEIDEEIEVTGENFHETTDTTTYRVTVYFSSEEASVNDDIGDNEDVEDYYEIVDTTDTVDDEGDWDTTFEVPDELTDGDGTQDVVGGTYYIYVTYKDNDNIEAMAEFTVIAGEIELNPDEGIVGSEVDISGQYFEGNDDIVVTIGDEEVDIESGTDDETDSSGDFDCTIIIPAATAGEHTIAVEDENDHIAEATFTVESALGVNPAEGAIGSQATTSGTGFGGSESVTITFDGTQVKTARTDSDGSFTASFTVPQVEAGTYTVEADDGDNSATASFTMSSSVTLGTSTSAASPGYVGMQMTMTGTGFLPNAAVSITYATTPVVVATTTSDANGDFSATFTIPSSEPGTHTITATDGINSLTETFYMESTAPSIPQPLLPEMGIKAKQPVYFDWADVTDPSGVTYTLQIATDENFASVVLEKTDLANSEYTITAAEKLEKRIKEAPYYWRVKATDGAYNESGWTGAGTFYVGGFGFGGISMPDWMIHLWWGLGAAGAGIGGFFMGKRRAYYY